VVHPLRELVPVETLVGGLREDLVVDVGDVADEVDPVAVTAERTWPTCGSDCTVRPQT
jgi:hypothetical protein